jgi:hypothetical protein
LGVTPNKYAHKVTRYKSKENATNLPGPVPEHEATEICHALFVEFISTEI